MSHYLLPSLKHMNLNADTNLDIKCTGDTDSRGAELNHQCSHHTLYASSALCNNEILHALDKFSSGRPEASHQFSLCQWLKERRKKKQTYQASNPFSENLKKLEVYHTFYPSKPTKKAEPNKAKGSVKNRSFSSGKNNTKTPKHIKDRQDNHLFLNIMSSQNET